MKYNSVDDIIQKYTGNINRTECNNYYLYRNTGNHALFAGNVQFANSEQSCTLKYNETHKSNNQSSKIFMNQSAKYKFTCNLHDGVHMCMPNDAKVRLTSKEKMYHDKTTYCRPVLNYYNEQFIYKTMERNARLKRLVRKLAIARQREKETVSWNNFINELMNKHGMKYDKPRQTPSLDESEEYNTPEIINDYYKNNNSSIESKPCEHLLQDFYESYGESHPNCILYRHFNENQTEKSKINKYLPHDRSSYCYPTSSHGRLIMMDRERRIKQPMNHLPNYLSGKYNVKGEIIKRCHDRTANTEIYKNSSISNGNLTYNRATNITKTSSVQTDAKIYPDFINSKFQDKATYKTDESIGVKQSHTYNNKSQENNHESQISLTNVDNKLETLIESINAFIDEIRSNKVKRTKTKYNYLNCEMNNINEKSLMMENESFSVQNNMNIIDSIRNHDFHHNHLNPTKINEILPELDMHNSKNMQISDRFEKKPCSVQITFEVPTRDCSTEVTKSLSKQNSSLENKEAIIEEISTPEQILPLQRMTIAVNTDPLSILGLLKISTDTFKRLLSYMPNIDYYSYLSLLQFLTTPKRIEPHYVCNICGADFSKPSQLSDHIQGHSLGKTRDCCVCRHVLDTARKSTGLFRCRYCGQLFARAYCCELHQESCARRLGKHHDVGSSLMLLR